MSEKLINHKKSTGQEEGENLEIKKLKNGLFYHWGVFNDEDIRKLSEETIRALLLVEGVICNKGDDSDEIDKKKFQAELLRHKSLPKPLLIEKNIFNLDFIKKYMHSEDSFSGFNRVGLPKLLQLDNDNIRFLIEKGALNTNTLLFATRVKSSFYKSIVSANFNWRKFVEDKQIDITKLNVINLGIDIDQIPEYEGFIHDNTANANSTETHGSRYGLPGQNIDPLIKNFRGSEKRSELSGQVKKALMGFKNRFFAKLPFLKTPERAKSLDDLDKVFKYYAEQSETFVTVQKETKISNESRSNNVRKVNTLQLEFLKNSKEGDKIKNQVFFNPEERYFDLYVRYGHGMMDPFQAAIIAKTVKWYIENGHSRLFTSCRLFTDRNTEILKQNESEHRLLNTPWLIKSVFPKIKIMHGVEKRNFIDSLIGANRFYLTHANIREAQDMGSTPIASLPVLHSPHKIHLDKDYIPFNADFDKLDKYRPDISPPRGKKITVPTGVEGDIQKLIEETLVRIRQLEDLEISKTVK